MITQILIQQTSIMFVLMLVGWLLTKFHLLTEKGTGDIGNILLYAVIPCVIIQSYITDYSFEKLKGLIISAILAVVAFLVAIVISIVAFGFRKNLEHFGTAFCNAGFIGIPLISSIFGTEAAFYIASFATILNILQWTYGIIIMTGDTKAINIKKMFINPVCIAFLIGCILFFTSFSLPALVLNTMGKIAALNTPVAMMILGFYLSKVNIYELFTDKSVYVSCLIRLIIIPMVTILLLRIIPFGHGQIGLITLIAASTPIGTTTAIFAQKFGQNYKKAVTLVCLSTIFSIVTVPVVITFAQNVF